ncbi:MAG: alginate export family protein [Bacteroidota bacterium]
MPRCYAVQLLCLNLILASYASGFCQDTKTTPLPAFQTERAAEDYAYLRDSSNRSGLARIKFIPLGAKEKSFLSLGGSFRPRMEHFTNRFWQEGTLTYYSQQLRVRGSLQLGSKLRFFGELQHGYVSNGQTLAQTEALDVHQGFLEVTFTTAGEQQWVLRAGRQEISLGAGRLVDLRSGVNVRRSFDMVRLIWKKKLFQLSAFYGQEVRVEFGAFDNAVWGQEAAADQPLLWGGYTRFPFSAQQRQHLNEVYYLGMARPVGQFNDVQGAEVRHSIGWRRFGNLKGKFIYNTELIYQWGSLAEEAIEAWSFETDWKFVLTTQGWRPMPGLKLDWASGDRMAGDGKVQSFNPLFVNPAIYSLAAVNTPVNLGGIHPSLTLFPTPKFLLNLEYAWFFRVSAADGLYIPPQFQFRAADGQAARAVGSVVGLFFQYTHSPYFTVDLRSSVFLPGAFVEASGSSATIFHLAPTATFTF